MEQESAAIVIHPETSSSVAEISYAFFILDNREFGIKVEHVRETIIHGTEFTRMPCSMDALAGLINLRGAIIPIINLRTRFHIDTPPPSTEYRIAITRFNDYLFGLIFDEISEVVRIKQDAINFVETSEPDPGFCNQGVISLDNGKRIVQLLDLERLFNKYNLPKIDNTHDEMRMVFRPRKQDITFMLDGQEYAIEVSAIREIIKPPKIRRKILVDPSIKGVIDLRSELINIVDLRKYFQAPEQEITAESRIIILQDEPGCGILVDAVKEVIHYEDDRLLTMPVFEAGQEKFAGIIAPYPGRNIIKLVPGQLFDRALLTQLQGNTELHAEKSEKKSDSAKQQDEHCADIANRVLISFRLGGDYAFDITLYREIINYPEGIVRLPGRQSYHEGILTLRNRAIPIVNLRRYYGMDDYANIMSSKIIILNLQEKSIGIVVDDILEIVKPDRMIVERIPNLAIAKGEPDTVNHVHEGYRFKSLTGEEKSLLIYDVEKLISDIEIPEETNVGNMDTLT